MNHMCDLALEHGEVMKPFLEKTNTLPVHQNNS